MPEYHYTIEGIFVAEDQEDAETYVEEEIMELVEGVAEVYFVSFAEVEKDESDIGA